MTTPLSIHTTSDPCSLKNNFLLLSEFELYAKTHQNQQTLGLGKKGMGKEELFS